MELLRPPALDDGIGVWQHVSFQQSSPTLPPSKTPLLIYCYRSTPIGQALGLATHTLYDPDSATGLLLVGTMNAISAGLLIFASLVELLSEDFLSDASWRILRGRRRVGACVLVLLGAVGMGVVGAWA